MGKGDMRSDFFPAPTKPPGVDLANLGMQGLFDPAMMPLMSMPGMPALPPPISLPSSGTIAPAVPSHLPTGLPPPTPVPLTSPPILIVSNLPPQWTAIDVGRFFETFGDVVDCDIIKNPDGSRTRKAYVKLSRYTEVLKAYRSIPSSAPVLGHKIGVEFDDSQFEPSQPAQKKVKMEAPDQTKLINQMMAKIPQSLPTMPHSTLAPPVISAPPTPTPPARTPPASNGGTSPEAILAALTTGGATPEMIKLLSELDSSVIQTVMLQAQQQQRQKEQREREERERKEREERERREQELERQRIEEEKRRKAELEKEKEKEKEKQIRELLKALGLGMPGEAPPMQQPPAQPPQQTPPQSQQPAQQATNPLQALLKSLGVGGAKAAPQQTPPTSTPPQQLSQAQLLMQLLGQQQQQQKQEERAKQPSATIQQMLKQAEQKKTAAQATPKKPDIENDLKRLQASPAMRDVFERRPEGRGAAYVVMKSPGQKFLQLSIELDLWYTTDEAVAEQLNMLLRNHETVIIIFTVKGNSYFTGYAEMGGRVKRREEYLATNKSSEVAEKLHSTWSYVFRVNWVRIESLEFINTLHLLTNDGRPVQYAKDGEAIPPESGAQLCTMMDRSDKAQKKQQTPPSTPASSAPATNLSQLDITNMTYDDYMKYMELLGGK